MSFVILDAHPADKTVKLYLERSAQFMTSGVPDDWRGGEEISSK